MKEINEKEMEQATGGADVPSLEEFIAQKSAATFREKGYTLVTDEKKGMTCEDYGRGWCWLCPWHEESRDTFECFCTKGH